MKELIKKVEQWFADREIIENSTALKQALKTSEEVLELQNAIIDDDLDEIKDAIGDIQVTLIGVCLHKKWKFENLSIHEDVGVSLDVFSDAVELEKSIVHLKEFIDFKSSDILISTLIYLNRISKHYDLTLEGCLKSAYDVIIKRTGKMVNGQFIKDSR
ncbi:hypothetical protein GO491_11695 [Flavobacteriaceae bacterium Ap0902]|nr:hypothetical protein [Flavobacteriaceae bacterium Ap0902]